MSRTYSAEVHAHARIERDRRRERISLLAPNFSTYMTHVVEKLGGSAAVATTTGFTKVQIESWADGIAVPYLRTLIAFAQKCKLPVNDVLRAAGKPPVATMRAAVEVNHETSLPSLMSAWRTENFAGDTGAAAMAMGISRTDFSRFANGSSGLRGIEITRKIARGLEMSIINVLDAAGEYDTPLRRQFEKMTTGFGGVIRMAVAELGVDPFDSSKRAEGAKALGVHTSRLSSWFNGASVASVLECQVLAKRTGLPLAGLFVATGMDAAVAGQLAESLGAGPARGRKPSLTKMLRTYRERAGLKQGEVARSLGFYSEHVISMFECGRTRPTQKTVIEIATLLDAPLGGLMRAAGYAA